MNIKVAAMFSGIGFQERGLELTNLFNVDVVATSEIDTNAIIGYAAIHNGLTYEMINNYSEYPSRKEMAEWLTSHGIGYDPMKNKQYDWYKKINGKTKDLERAWLACQLNKNVGDISKIESLPSCDLLTWSSPCTDISIAGSIRGFAEDSGTRSSMLWHVVRLLRDYKDRNDLPKYLLFENVKNIVSKNFIDNFNEVIGCLDDLGYNSYWEIINGKNCGVPQNRERVFMISIRKDIDTEKFEFPTPFDSGLRLKDILLPNVDSKYYITNERADNLIEELILNGKVRGI